jgi:hypothetical protein
VVAHAADLLEVPRPPRHEREVQRRPVAARVLDEHAGRLAADPPLRARLGAAGRETLSRRYPPEREIEGYLDVYRRLIPVPAA